MKPAKYIAIDCETGGFLKHYPSLLTVFFLALDEDLNPVDELDLAIKSADDTYVVTAQALQVNKIDLIEHDKIAITEKEARIKARQFLGKLNPQGKNKLIPIGQNVHFDLEFLKADFTLNLKDTLSKYVSHRILDTMHIAKFLQLIGKLPDGRCNLDTLIEHYGVKIDEKDRHTARGDVLATVNVLKGMINEFK